MEEHECFVCAQSYEPLHRACACNMLVHRECLERLIREVEAHSIGCPVCRQTYQHDVTVTHRWMFDEALCNLYVWLGITWTTFATSMFVDSSEIILVLRFLSGVAVWWSGTAAGLICCMRVRNHGWKSLCILRRIASEERSLCLRACETV